MIGLLLRILFFAAIAIAVWWGVRKIWRDWSGAFRAEDKARLDRDRAERDQIKRADGMITLQRDKDGKFRPED